MIGFLIFTGLSSLGFPVNCTIAVCVPIASAVIMVPFMFRQSSSSGIALISFVYFTKKEIKRISAGHLRIQNGYYQMILSYKDENGKCKTKSSQPVWKQRATIAMRKGQKLRELLLRIKEEQAEQRRVCGKSYCTEYPEYIYLDPAGKLIRPDFVTQHFSQCDYRYFGQRKGTHNSDQLNLWIPIHHNAGGRT